jgi:hypothetical protein
MAIITNYNRIIHTLGFVQFEKMYNELSIYLNETEQNKCLDFMITIENSKYDINPTIDDCKTQMRLILGSDRYLEVVENWKRDNQKVLSIYGRLKYKYKVDGSLWDGLDPEDDPNQYEKVYI